MINISRIGWGSYDKFEGPYFWGSYKHSLPQNPTFEQKVLSVVTSTEGGSYDAVNMYDRCVLTVGVIQYCEAVMAFSRMLGYCASHGDLDSINDSLSNLPIPLSLTLKSNSWAFTKSDGTPITDNNLRREVFLGGSTGFKGQWENDQKDFAKQVALIFANMWDDPSLRKNQSVYAGNTILSFTSQKSHAIMNSLPNGKDESGWIGGLRAALASYSANLPAVAETMLTKATQHSKWNGSDKDKFFVACREMALGSTIRIWPERWGKISPVIGKIFNIDSPTLDELKSFDSDELSACTEDLLDTTVEIQKFLISQGYDLGPSKADGIYGKLTKKAVESFQSAHGQTPTGYVDDATKEEMLKLICLATTKNTVVRLLDHRIYRIRYKSNL